MSELEEGEDEEEEATVSPFTSVTDDHSVLIRGDTAGWRWLLAIEGVGARAGDHRTMRRRKSLTVVGSLLIAALSPAWYLPLVAFGIYRAALFPLLYQLLTLIHLWLFRRSGDLRRFGLGQALLLALFSVGVHLSLGGTVESGATLMWTFLVPLLALLGRGPRSGSRHFFAVSLLVFGCVLLEYLGYHPLQAPGRGLSGGARVFFFLFNLLGVSALSYLILRYFVSQMHAERLEQRRLNRALGKANEALREASAHKSAFLAQMSHELRTPLNAIIGYSEMLEEEHGEMEAVEVEEDLRKIKGSGKHLLALINDILDLSKIEAGKLEITEESYDLRELIEEVASTAELAIRKNHNSFAIRIEEGLGIVKGDRLRTAQVLHNLLSNAAKFTEGGEVCLEAEHLLDEQGEGWIRISVRDTGIGISEAQKKKLFLDFSQADKRISVRYGGTGLGLSLSRRLCRMMGGEIGLKSELGVGSTFTLRLPDGLLPIERELRGITRGDPSADEKEVRG